MAVDTLSYHEGLEQDAHQEATPGPSNLQNAPVSHPPPRPPLAGGIPLRIMFLGASVTRGAMSIGNLGYRSPLRDQLAALGNPINTVGTQRVGAFIDNDVEAYPGARIDQIHVHAQKSVPGTKPNLFILHVGTNDCLQKHDTAHAGARLRDLVTYLLRASPRATVVLSSLLTNTVRGKEACIVEVNAQIRRLASALQREGKPVVLAEMHYEQGVPDRPVPADISADGTHPFDRGYGLMAAVFFDAVVEADRRGFLRAPEENGVAADGVRERADEPFVFLDEELKKTPVALVGEKIAGKKGADVRLGGTHGDI